MLPFVLLLLNVQLVLSTEVEIPSCRAICVETHRNFATYFLRNFEQLQITEQIFNDICFTIEAFKQCFTKCGKSSSSTCVLNTLQIPGAACALTFLQVAKIPECYNKLKPEMEKLDVVNQCRRRCCNDAATGTQQTSFYSLFYCSDHSIDSLQFMSNPRPANQAKKNDLCQVTCVMNTLGVLSQQTCNEESTKFFTSVGAILHKFHSEQEHCLDHLMYNNEPVTWKIKIEL
uniref:Chondroitin proteoglycan 4 domain-containing protein n=1 Tax=Panagrellus redivivus TaxID=6233 RepID=A0A7E4ZSK6_PANRE